MYVTKELALKMETCFKKTHIKMATFNASGRVLEVGEGAACFAGFSSFFSQVIAWGFSLKTKQFQQQMNTIEHFYSSLRHPRVDIELCPLVGNDLAHGLSQRGYLVTELNNIHFMFLDEYRIFNTQGSSFEVRQVPTEDLLRWAKSVALGFGYLEAQEQFAQYACLADVTVFAVYEQGEIIAGATVAINGDVADLGVTSTIPIHRGKGLQKLLLQARLNFIKNKGISLALVTTEPDSISSINVQKVGFRCAYTRIKFTKLALNRF